METILHVFSIFILIFCRISAFFVVAPIFSSRGVPNTFKIGLSGIIAVLVLLIQGAEQVIPNDLGYVLIVIREVLIGLLLGFTAQLIFYVIQIAGSFIDIQIGFGIANVVDPMTGASAPILGNFKYIIAMLLFLTINGHHYLIDGIIRSYNWVPLSNNLFQEIYNGKVSEFLITTFTQSFALAFQMAAPLVVALFVTDVALGFLARTAPQFNVFVIGIPLKIIVGLVVLLLLISSFVFAFQHLFEFMFKSLQNLLGVIGERP